MQAGDALWLKLDRGVPLSWTQLALVNIDALQLRRGANVAVWAWPHDSWAVRQYLWQSRWDRELPEFSAWDAAATVLGANLNAVWRWNARSQSFEPWGRGVPIDHRSRNIPALQTGEALLVNVSNQSHWRAPKGPAVVGTEWLTVEQERELRTAIDRVYDFFDGHLGLDAPHAAISITEFPFPCLNGGSESLLILYLPCEEIEWFIGVVLSQHLIDRLERRLRQAAPRSEPGWLALGLGHYTAARYRDSRGIHPLDKSRETLLEVSRSTSLKLDDPLLSRSVQSPEAAPLWARDAQVLRDVLEALAVEWLVETFGEAAVRSYNTAKRSIHWAEAFEQAFGRTADEALEDFEAHRLELSLIDGQRTWSARPYHQVAMLGVLAERRWETTELVEQIINYFDAEHDLKAGSATFILGLLPVDYQVLGGEPGYLSCGRTYDSVVLVVAGCGTPQVIAHEYVHVLQGHLRVGTVLPNHPSWLLEGHAEHLAYAFVGAMGIEEHGGSSLYTKASDLRRIPSWLGAGLSDEELAQAALDNERYLAGEAAVKLIIELFGHDALLELLGPTDTSDFNEHFESATGTSLSQFLAQFGKHLRSLPGQSS